MLVYYLWTILIACYLTVFVVGGLFMAGPILGLKWFIFVPSLLNRKSLYAVVLLEKGLHVAKHGDWTWNIRYHHYERTYSGEWTRKGRWVFFYPAPKRKPKRKTKAQFKPGFNFG